MEFGLTMFPSDEAVDPVTLGRAAEDAGFESLFFPEHTHIPASRESPWPGGDELPREYWHTYDPFVALSAVAARTERLRVGTGICLVVERDPITLAKEVASLDRLSGGRFEFGIGAGWNREEMRHHGTDPRVRMAVLRERVLAMREIWTRDEPEFHGEHVDFERLWSWPKPVQQPHPPVLVGGDGPTVFDRVLELGDAWFPNTRDIESLPRRISELRARGADAGRERIPVTYFGARPDDGFVDALRRAGVDRALLRLPSEPAERALPNVERFGELAQRHR
jgi:probable F420-dependent oxidoreductase